MDLALTEEQEALTDLFMSFFTRELPSDRVRASEATGFDRDLWDQLAGTGALAIGIEDSDLRDATLLAEVAGRHAAPLPLVESITLGRLLARAPAADERLAAVSAGRRIGTVALHPAVEGVAAAVPAGAIADLVAVVDQADLVLLDGWPTPSLHPNLAGTPIADRPCTGHERGRSVIASGSAALEHLAMAQRDWRVLTAASLVGIGAAALDLTVAYVAERRQFDRPVGSFQAIAHPLVDVATAIDGARLLVREAAWAVDTHDDAASALAIMALRFAAEAAQQASTTGLHDHGGYGFMLEYDIQLHYRRAKAWPLPIGTPEQERQRLAAELWMPTKDVA